MPHSPDHEHEGHEDPHVEDAHDEHEDHGEGHEEGHEGHEKSEEVKLQKALDVICKVAKAGEKSGFGVDAVAEAVYFLRTSKLTWPLRAAWNVTPAGIQREVAGTNPSAAGTFLMRYLPALNLRNYTPGFVVAALAKTGVVEFNLNKEEIAAMEAELGKDATEAAKAAYKAEVESKLAAGIVMPYEGAASVLTGKAGAVISTLEPELKPVVAVAKGAEVVAAAEQGYLAQVRERVYALELEAAQKLDAKNAVPEALSTEHTQVVEELEPEVHLDHGEERHAA